MSSVGAYQPMQVGVSAPVWDFHVNAQVKRVSAGTGPLLREQDRPAGSDQGSGPRAGSEQHQGQLRGPRGHPDPLQRRGEQQHPSPASIRRGAAPTSHFSFFPEQLWENEAVMDEFKKQLSIKRCG